MKKSLIVAAIALASAPAWAQSNVTLYGIVDMGLRHTTNEGPATDKGQSRTAMVGGGMSQSRWGIRGTEDLGGGSKVLFNMEQRVLPQTGAIIGGATAFQQAWVAYENASFGRITLGRQYNALFDLYTSTFVSYPYSPYFDQFKPEVGFSAAARFNELIKYTANFGQFRFQVEATLRGETDTAIAGAPGVYNTGGKGYAGYLRWANAGWAFGVGALKRDFGADGKSLKAVTLGGSYTSGPWYFTAHAAQNRHNLAPRSTCTADPQCQLDYTTLGSMWSGTANGGFSGAAFTAANKRQMISVGMGYQVTPQLNLGGHYWYARQTGHSALADGKAHFISFVADYALSKRSDVYAEVDYTKLKTDNASLNNYAGAANGAKSRAGFTVGFRHRF